MRKPASSLPVALVAADAAARQRLLEASQALELPVVFQGNLDAMGVAALDDCAAKAWLIAVDADTEEALDTIQMDALGHAPLLLFEDAQVVLERDGWEHARWLRHLAAKLGLREGVLPPVEGQTEASLPQHIAEPAQAVPASQLAAQTELEPEAHKAPEAEVTTLSAPAIDQSGSQPQAWVSEEPPAALAQPADEAASSQIAIDTSTLADDAQITLAEAEADLPQQAVFTAPADSPAPADASEHWLDPAVAEFDGDLLLGADSGSAQALIEGEAVGSNAHWLDPAMAEFDEGETDSGDASAFSLDTPSPVLEFEAVVEDAPWSMPAAPSQDDADVRASQAGVTNINLDQPVADTSSPSQTVQMPSFSNLSLLDDTQAPTADHDRGDQSGLMQGRDIQALSQSIANWSLEDIDSDTPPASPASSAAQVSSTTPTLDTGLSLESIQTSPALSDDDNGSVAAVALTEVPTISTEQASASASELPPPLPGAVSELAVAATAQADAPSTSSVRMVLVIAGIGGPDAVRRLLSALPADFHLPLVLQQALGKPVHERLVSQLGRATALKMRLAEVGAPVTESLVHVLPQGVGVDLATNSFVLSDSLDEAIADARVAVVMLSGAAPDLVPRLLQRSQPHAPVLAQDVDSCYDKRAVTHLIEHGIPATTPEQMAMQLAALPRH